MSSRPIIALIMLAFVLPHAAVAHTTGASYEQTAGNYIIDVGYDPAIYTAGNYERFDFNLKDRSQNPTDFAEVWVRILQERTTLLATGLRRQPFGPTTLLYTFANPGDYVLEASYRTADGEELAVGRFPFSVESVTGSDARMILWLSISGFLGACIGALLIYVTSRRGFKNPPRP